MNRPVSIRRFATFVLAPRDEVIRLSQLGRSYKSSSWDVKKCPRSPPTDPVHVALRAGKTRTALLAVNRVRVRRVVNHILRDVVGPCASPGGLLVVEPHLSLLLVPFHQLVLEAWQTMDTLGCLGDASRMRVPQVPLRAARAVPMVDALAKDVLPRGQESSRWAYAMFAAASTEDRAGRVLQELEDTANLATTHGWYRDLLFEEPATRIAARQVEHVITTHDRRQPVSSVVRMLFYLLTERQKLSELLDIVPSFRALLNFSDACLAAAAGADAATDRSLATLTRENFLSRPPPARLWKLPSPRKR